MRDQPKELEDAVCNVIQIIKQIPELVDTRLTVVGGLALWHYLPTHRPANSIDFVTNLPTLDFLRQKLLEHPNSPFTQNKQVLLYHSPAGRDIRIKMSSQWLYPHLPDPEHVVYGIPYGQVPYISLEDLVAFKINSSYSKASTPVQRRQDADDAAALVDHELARQTLAQRTAWVNEKLEAYERKVLETLAIRARQQEVALKEALWDVYPAFSSPMHTPALET
ncbi:hypothetical protein F5Y12DRAFT_787725 [Xylaria sp. FL1777]|nr:hypothetical protein F5Y12DRAFT_787725 [Xylaria sp. FL1777]